MGACGVGQCLSGESDKGGWSWEGKRVLVLKWLLLMEGKEGQKKEEDTGARQPHLSQERALCPTLECGQWAVTARISPHYSTRASGQA